MTRLVDAGFTMLGWSFAAAAWAFCLATYPLVIAYVWLTRRAYWAFADEMDRLHRAWTDREEAMAA